MLEIFEDFAQQEYLPSAHQDMYMRSHPAAAQRIAQLRDLVARSPYLDAKDPPALQFRHDMVRAKLAGYLQSPQTVFNEYRANDSSLPARYARAIARNCKGKCDQAIGEVDALIKERPDNPFFWEIKGSFLRWSGKSREAIPSLRKALQLSGGNESLIQTELAQAMLATEDPALLEEAMPLLKRAILTDPTHPIAHHQLAIAFYRKGQYPQADLAAAQGYFAEGNIKQAQTFAGRALAKLPRGTPDWIRAEDITKYKAPPT
jgi:predicted Zn-dependent protease